MHGGNDSCEKQRLNIGRKLQKKLVISAVVHYNQVIKILHIKSSGTSSKYFHGQKLNDKSSQGRREKQNGNKDLYFQRTL